MKIKTVHTGGFATNVVDDALVKYGMELSRKTSLLQELINRNTSIENGLNAKQFKAFKKLTSHSNNAGQIIFEYINGVLLWTPELEIILDYLEKYVKRIER